MGRPVPSVGRIVHYRYGGQCVAGIVLRVDSPTDLTLQVFPVDGTPGQVWAGQDDDGRESGTWHWPERV